ncbi:adenylate/guanylate cyclase domain-containing protein [Novosphingobium sp. 17-62-19]|uniref:adenylate/guanylate cyclase domain-containing protein n=1 Tax=Novosphingobium sp. 17-62-19 TaxID=1970406 RepID=UPI0025D6D37D|nr:adenylate/guanylate cyclase domain-containing protein [Novosphingobium sp. 17-62-19]HQS96675.1 adenylate/guanylate cyclase domain-containing protein [Novosphingobium sp.]
MRVAGAEIAGNAAKGTGGPVALPESLSGDVDSIRFVTILFADIVGSTRLLRALDPEDGRDLLDSSLALIQQAIHEFGGLVVRIQGDGVMAVFGVQPAAEDHALRGALAALRIGEKMKSGALGFLPAPQVRVGLHAGPILLRRQDNDFGSILDVVGHSAHVAGQIEKMAPPGSVAISATVASLIAEPCELRPAGSVESGGSESPEGRGEAVFELLSVDFLGSDRVTVKGNATYPVIGRDAELEQVRQLVGGLASGQHGSLAIIGEAGMGKSRLLLEASRLAAGFGTTFAAVRGNALLAAVPFGCLGGTLRHLIDLLHPFTPDPAAAAAAQLSANETACLEGLTSNEPGWLAHLPPGDRSRIAAGTMVRIVELAAAHMRLVLLVDDAHYLDSETLTVLATIARGGRIAMIVAGRPEAAPRIEGMCTTLLRLDSLSQSAARTLVSLIHRLAPIDDSVIDHVIERAAGLPLALQEFAVILHSESGAAAVAADNTDPMSAAPLPARLDSLLAARLATLDADAGKLCQFCAALGPAFPMNRLQRGAALVCRNPSAAVSRLIDARVIEFSGTGQARFTHQLVQEAAYRAMARRRRTAMHASALDMLKQAKAEAAARGTAGDEMASHAELANHAEKAGLYTEAMGHLWEACVEALSLAAIDSVRQLHERACAVAAYLPATQAAFERARFALLAADTLQQLSLEQVLRDDIQAVAEGRVDLGSSLRTVARINMALLDWIDGAPVRGRAWLTQAETDLDAHDSLPRRTYADLVAAYLAFSMGDPTEAVTRIERLGNRLADGLRGETFGAVVVIPHVLARAFGAWYLVDLGQTAKARVWVAEALNLSRRYGHAYSRMLAQLAQGYLHYRGGNCDRALPILRRAYADCLHHNFVGFEPACASWLALCLIELGLLDEAASILSQSVERGNFRKVRTSATYYLHEARARLSLAKGEAVEATKLAALALGHARDCEDVVHELHARVLCAEVSVRVGVAGDVDEALYSRVTELGLVVLQRRMETLWQ